MGSKTSKPENTGTVINDIQIQPASVENTDLIVCIYIITALLIVQFVYKLYKIFHRNMKKKYVPTV